MNITFHSISQSASWFKTQITSVTTQQKKIVAVVAFALGCLALCYYAIKRYCFKVKSVELQGEYPVKTWDLRMDSTYKRSLLLPEGYDWVKGQDNAQKFMRIEKDLDKIIEVARFAYAQSGANRHSLLYIGDLVIHAQNLLQLEAIVKTVATSKEHMRAIFSALFLQMPNASIENKLQRVVSYLSHEQLMNVLALDNNRSDFFYQREQSEIRKIELHNYLRYWQILNLPKEFMAKCLALVKYADYVRVKAEREVDEIALLVE